MLLVEIKKISAKQDNKEETTKCILLDPKDHRWRNL